MIINFEEKYFKQISQILINEHIHDELNNELIHEKFFSDPDFNPENIFIYIDNEKVVGILFGVIRKIRGENLGFIKLAAVHKNYRRKHIATQLYQKTEEKFKQEKVSKIRIYDVPLNYFMPGVDPKYTPAICFLQKNGFKHIGDAINMDVHLDQNFDVRKDIERLKSENVEVSRATVNDKNELFKFVKEEWLLWINELEMTYKSNPVSLFIARKNNKIKAFSAYDANNKGIGWFGPMGTHKDMRGLGIGSVLLKLCLQDIKNQGLKKSIIPWVAPIGFYSHYVNAEISRVFWRYEKSLKN